MKSFLIGCVALSMSTIGWAVNDPCPDAKNLNATISSAPWQYDSKSFWHDGKNILARWYYSNSAGPQGSSFIISIYLPVCAEGAGGKCQDGTAPAKKQQPILQDKDKNPKLTTVSPSILPSNAVCGYKINQNPLIIVGNGGVGPQANAIFYITSNSSNTLGKYQPLK